MVLWTESGQVRGQAICRSKLGDYYLVQGYRGNRRGYPADGDYSFVSEVLRSRVDSRR
jgi:hypothetical protein